MFGINPRAAEIGLLVSTNQEPQPTGILSALQGMDIPEVKMSNYFTNNVKQEELGESDRQRLYVPETDKYKAYQVGKEERLTVGEGVYLDDNALKYLGLKRKDVVEGTEIDADLVNKLGSKRWNQAVKNSKKILGDKNSSVGAFAEMIYQMGLPSAKGFDKTIKLLKKDTVESIEEAKREAKRGTEEGTLSKWYRETKDRADRVIERMGQSKL